ncbi:glycerol-3-phosphate 1-O-acyltransferase PlsY [Indioceanicola profundi]|uniref:glycerol-3-phosphate 1-O-acyltransferase PlsY n=1 Tax=Indioceanicola profundi TaxID=2220096 RepID=UPI000E6AB5D2|nr:glycerol-3-phosphate 1-O-acyltransferase PlsY [Indioceanicola profundi]
MPDPISWELSWPYLLAAFASGYLLGSIPFGLVLTRLAGYGDIRKIGSGNIGATNVLRTGNKLLALATLLLDSGKGAIAVGIAWALAGQEAAVLAAAGSMLGHSFPVWLGFKGGKGVATALGVLLAISWPVGVLACLTWLLAAVLFRISSLSALLAFAVATAYAAWIGWLQGAGRVGGAWAPPVLAGDVAQAAVAPGLWQLMLFITVLVYIRHKDNIRRILNGTEPRIGAKKKQEA